MRYKRFYLLLLLPISCIITLIAQKSAQITEKYFTGYLYRFLSIPYSRLTSRLPFSLGEILVICIPVAVIALTIYFVVRMIKGSGKRGQILLHAVMNLACAVSVIFFFYTILCGVNYYRYSFTHFSNLTIHESSSEELYDLCMDLTKTANELRENIPSVNDKGVFTLSTSMKATAKKADEAMNLLSEEYPVMAGWSAVPKKIQLSKLMSYTQLTGVFFPFTMEANVNTDVPDYSIPSTMCHELSHLRGFMREDEANYIAYLACMKSNDVEFQYSGVMEALILSGNALYEQDKLKYEKVSAKYSEGVRSDLIANSEYWKKFEHTKVSKVSDQVNDTYLKVNQQSDGVKSYGRMVDLLLAQYRKKNKLS